MKKLISSLFLTGMLGLSANAQFYVNPTNGKVGIGTTSPSYPLDVNGIINATAYYVNGVPFAGGGSQWTTSGTNIYYPVSGSGNVGIGINSPSARLQVEGSIFSNSTRTNSVFNGVATPQNADFIGSAGYWAIRTSTNNAFNLDVYNVGTALAALTVLQNGYVGIGTISPTAPIDVAGDMKLSGQILLSGSARIAMPANQANVFVGHNSGIANTTGNVNTAIGNASLGNNTTGSENVANGSQSLVLNTTGTQNVAVGTGSLFYNTTGSYNTAIGDDSGPLTGTFTNSTSLGWAARATTSNQVRIGNSSVTSIGGQVSWTTLSDARFKTDVTEDVSGLEFINQLRPVSYSVDQDKLDSFLGIREKDRHRDQVSHTKALRQTGFVAQEVEAVIKRTGFVFHGIEAPQNDRDHYSIRYAEFVVPLVKAVQELSAKVEKQQSEIQELKKGTGKKFSETKNSFDGVELFQNTPNPFRQDTEIRMNIPSDVQSAVLFIYDLSGKQIDRRLITERGQVVTKVEGGRLAAGMYLYTLIADNQPTEAKRMVLTE